MLLSTLKISSKGQIMLSKKIRKILNSDVVSITLNDDNQVLITPVHELAGSLSSYKKDTSISFEEIRVESWENSTSHLVQKINVKYENKK